MRRILAMPVLFFSFSCGVFAQHAGLAGAPGMMPAQGARVASPIMPGGVRPAMPMASASAIHPAPHVATGAPGVHHIAPTMTGTHGTALRAPSSSTSPRAHMLTGGNPRQNATNVDEFGASFAADQLNVPGLGFDYVHFAAVHPNAGKNHFDNGLVMPFLGGGIYVPAPYYAEQPAAPAAVESPAPETSEATEGSSDVDASAATSVAPRNTPKLEPSSEYVFVRRDGTVFFAVAYSLNAGNLQYVTKEGLRRSVPLSTLDLDATQQFNEQRGVTVRLPA
jgi:hypothetical protein